MGRRVLIYGISKDEIIDPNTGESLGHLEIVKGTGQVIHIQDKRSTIESDRKIVYRKRLDNTNPFFMTTPLQKAEVIEYDEPKPFEYPEIDDRVKPI